MAERGRNNTMGDLKVAVVLTFAIFIAELAGGILSNSLALLSDAGHVFMDFFALLLTFLALKVSSRKSTYTQTFGYHRAEIMVALVNSLTLIGISFMIIYEAFRRLLAPPQINTAEMLVVAFIGLAVNVYVLRKLRGHYDLNVRSAFLHVVGDTLSSVVVIGTGLWILFTGEFFWDPALSVVIAVIILAGALRLMRDSSHILLEGAPKNIRLKKIIKEIEGIRKVRGVHDVHVWSICSNIHIFSAHIFVDDIRMSEAGKIRDKIKAVLEKHGIRQSTIQFECGKCDIKTLHTLNH